MNDHIDEFTFLIIIKRGLFSIQMEISVSRHTNKLRLYLDSRDDPVYRRYDLHTKIRRLVPYFFSHSAHSVRYTLQIQASSFLNGFLV